MEQSILNVIENILTKGKTQIVITLFISNSCNVKDP